MASAATSIRIQAIVDGLDKVEGLKNSLKQLQNTITPATADLDRLKQAARALGSATEKTENDLRATVAVLRDVRSNVALNTAEFRKLTAEIGSYERQLSKATATSGRFSKAGQITGTIAASGVFGGVEGALGAGIGAFFGPGGAIAGGAIGAQVGQVRQMLGQTASYSAELEKQRIALRQIVGSNAEYVQSLAFVENTSQRLAIPQDILIKNFTRLAASVKGAGGNISDAEKAFNGISAGILGTGGSLENLDAALLATSQVFSKGKVSAEELRGQIGERLPGAFNLFAESVKMTPQELDEALQDGKVTLADFQKFSEELFKKYAKAADLIASSPENAGNRLQTTLKSLGDSVGTLLRPIGAAFQNTFSNIIQLIDKAIRRLNTFLGLNPSQQQGKLQGEVASLQASIAQDKEDLKTGARGARATASLPQIIKDKEAKLLAVQTRLGQFAVKPEKPSSGLSGSGSTAGGSVSSASSASERPKFELSSRAKALVNASRKLGVSPLDLATIIDYETIGTYSPSIMGGTGNNYMGLIQFGPTERKQYGAYAGQSFEEQVQGPVVRFLQDRFKNVGRSTQGATLSDLYRTINGGNPNASLGKFDGNGTIAQHIQRMTGANRARALRTFFGGNTGNVGYGALEAGVDAAQAYEEQQKMLQQSMQAGEKIIAQMNEQNDLIILRTEYERELQQLLWKQQERETEIGKLLDSNQRTKAKTLNDELKNLELIKLQNTSFYRQAGLDQREYGAGGSSGAFMTNIDVLGQQDSLLSDILNKYPLIGQAAAAAGELVTQGTRSMIDGTQSAKEVFSNFLKSIADMLLQTVQQMITQYIALGVARMFAIPGSATGGLGAAGSSFGAAAFGSSGSALSSIGLGSLFSASGPSFTGFAKGGIVNKPTMFRYASGGAFATGLMGEAGPEAIVPLRRGRDGKLGIAGGGGQTSVVVNVDAKGTNVQGDNGKGEGLGKVLAAAVQQELIRQRRPGGLLAA